MKTIYLRRKASGNYEFSERTNATHKFKTQKAFKEWYKKDRTKSFEEYSGYRYYRNSRIIKATYSRSQTYFYDANECLTFIKKNNIF